MAIAVDATSLGNRFVVLAISIVYRGCAVPVAWKVLKAQEKHARKPEWQALLKRFQGLLPEGWMVIVLVDRSLYAKWLFEAIVKLRWQPFSCLVPAKGRRWQGRGTAFSGKKSQLRCTLLGYWGEEHQDPWLVLTDLAPECADACWYGLRAWIEQGFKHSKQGGWQWQHTRMDDPARAERLWMAIAIATWWLLSVGGEAEASHWTSKNLRFLVRYGGAQTLADGGYFSARLVFDYCGFA